MHPPHCRDRRKRKTNGRRDGRMVGGCIVLEVFERKEKMKYDKTVLYDIFNNTPFLE